MLNIWLWPYTWLINIITAAVASSPSTVSIVQYYYSRIKLELLPLLLAVQSALLVVFIVTTASVSIESKMYSHCSENLPFMVLAYLSYGIICQISLYNGNKELNLYSWPPLQGKRYFSFVARFLAFCGNIDPTWYSISQCHMSLFLFTLSRTITKIDLILDMHMIWILYFHDEFFNSLVWCCLCIIINGE